MNYSLESKLATIAFKFYELERELKEIDNSKTWNEVSLHYNGHPLKNLDEYVNDRKDGRI